jgi:hypothetical protein
MYSVSFLQEFWQVYILKTSIIDSFCLSAKGISYLFPIQSKTYDHVFSGQDMIAQASKLNLMTIIVCSKEQLSLFSWQSHLINAGLELKMSQIGVQSGQMGFRKALTNGNK